MGPTCMMGVAATWVMVGIAWVALRDWALKTCHCAVVLLASLALVPQNAMFTWPEPPAVTQGPMAVLLPAPLFTRTGVVHVPPWLVEAVRNTLVPLQNTTYTLLALSMATTGKIFARLVPAGAAKTCFTIQVFPPSEERASQTILPCWSIKTVYTLPLFWSTVMLPWSPGCTPISGVVTGATCGQVRPLSNDLATKRVTVPSRSAPSCLVVRYSSLLPWGAIHWRSTKGRSLEIGLETQTVPPVKEVLCVAEPSHNELAYTTPEVLTAISSSPPPRPTPSTPRAAPICTPSGCPR